MNFRLLLIGTMYPGSLDLFYRMRNDIESFSYTDHNRLLLNTTSEFIGSYYKNFRKQGIEADAIVVGDISLQTKWKKEHGGSDDPGKILLEQVNYYKPDVLFIENLSVVDDIWINQARENVKLIIGYHCAPLNSRVERSIKACDIILTCTPGLKDFFISGGKNTYLIYHAFDEDNLKFLDPKLDDNCLDLVFSGSLTTGGTFHNERIRLIEGILAEGIDIRLYVNLESSFRIKAKQALYIINSSLNKVGLYRISEVIKILEHGRSKVENYSQALLARSLPPVFGAEMLNLFGKSKIVLNYHIGVAGEYAGNMRMFEVTGAGSCLLTDNKKNMNDLFSDGKEAVLYNDKDDCIKKIKWLLEHDHERKEIADAGHARTLSEHTVFKRCELIREIIEAGLKK